MNTHLLNKVVLGQEVTAILNSGEESGHDKGRVLLLNIRVNATSRFCRGLVHRALSLSQKLESSHF